MKKENIVKYWADELRVLNAAGQTHSDWRAAAQQALPDGSDLDDAMEPIE